jgi:hypothetical protein
MTPPKDSSSSRADQRYLAIVSKALEVSRRYQPRFGTGSKDGLSVDEFQHLYHNDPFYCWFGLDSPLIYSAHRAAGGMTSLYRQIGIACECLFRQLLQDCLGLDARDVSWSYQVPSGGGKSRTLSLDARLPVGAIRKSKRVPIAAAWLRNAAAALKVPRRVANRLEGAVFEVRQGYKSKDSKRQNADIGNAANAYANSYLPVVVLLSAQMDRDIVDRYTRAQWLILTGTIEGSSIESTYAFTREIVGYDLAAFFRRNARQLRREVELVTEALLR